MTRRTLAVAVLLASPLAAPGGPPAPDTLARLIEQLGSDDFAEREAASKRLAGLGPAALADIRTACASPDPEVARRARDLAAGIGRRVENEKTLAPTLVDLAAADTPLDAVLADLSKQSGYQVVLGGLKAEDLATKRVTLKTGRVAFWDAVKVVSDAAGLQVASVGGFTAPGSLPYTYRSPNGALGVNRAQQLGADRPPPPAGPGPIAKPIEEFKRSAFAVRTAPLPNESVVLEARDVGKLRPWASYGAVAVEVFPLPTPPPGADAAWSLLQVWPEPKLSWRETRAVSVRRAADEHEQALRALPHVPAPATMVIRGRAFNGNVMIQNDGFSPTPAAFPTFQPNVRQSAVKFKAAEKPSAALREFAGSVYGVIRSPLEPLAVAELEEGKEAVAGAVAGVSLKATLVRGEAGETRVDVELAFAQQAIEMARVTDALPGAKNPTTVSNNTVHGLRVTDADGNPLSLTVQQITQRIMAPAGALTYGFRFSVLRPPGKVVPLPKTITFWGTHGKTVEVPFDLRDAPIAAGKK